MSNATKLPFLSFAVVSEEEIGSVQADTGQGIAKRMQNEPVLFPCALPPRSSGRDT